MKERNNYISIKTILNVEKPRRALLYLRRIYGALSRKTYYSTSRTIIQEQ